MHDPARMGVADGLTDRGEDAQEASQLLVRGDVGPRTLVWCETLTDWTEAGSLAEFREYFDA